MRLSVTVEPRTHKDQFSIRYYDPATGERRRVKCNKENLKIEKNRIESMLLHYEAGTGDPDAIPLVRFEEYLRIKQTAGKLRPSTVEMKRKNLEHYLKNIFKLSQITRQSILQYITHMSDKGYKTDTIAIRLRDLRAFINWLRKEKLVLDSPFEGIEIPVSSFVGRRLTMNEIKAIYGCLKGKFRLFVTLALETGARHGELLAMEWSEIDLYQKSWYIPAHKCKTKVNRTLHLPEASLQGLSLLPQQGKRVFEGWSRFMTQKYWTATLRKSHIEGRIRIHDLRHTFASNWKGRAASLKAVAGWTTDAMMAKYTHTELNYLAEETDRSSKSFWAGFGPNEPKDDIRTTDR